MTNKMTLDLNTFSLLIKKNVIVCNLNCATTITIERSGRGESDTNILQQPSQLKNKKPMVKQQLIIISMVSCPIGISVGLKLKGVSQA